MAVDPINTNPTSNQFNPNPVQQYKNVKAVAKDNTFKNVVGATTNVIAQVAGAVVGGGGLGGAPLAARGVGGIASLISGGIGGGGGSVASNFNEGDLLGSDGNLDQFKLLKLQEQIQRESQIFNMVTNISKTDHDTKMSAIRNIKA